MCNAASFPYSGHFMCSKDPPRLRKMSSSDLLNKRLPPAWSRDVHHDCLQSFRMCDTCVTMIRCKSLNFRLKNKSCELNDAGRYAHPKDYGPKAGFIYMDVSESPKVCLFYIFPMLVRFIIKFGYSALSLVERGRSIRV